MTPDQLQRANVLMTKIKNNEEIVTRLKATDSHIEEKKISATLAKLAFHPKGEMAHEIAINPEWYNSEEIKAEFQAALKAAKDSFIALMEKDLQLMKDELANL